MIKAAQRQADRYGIDLDDPILTTLSKTEPWMEFYFRAKRELNTCINVNGHIPWTSIRDYAQTYGLDVEELDRLVSYIRAMESGLSRAREQSKPTSEKGLSHDPG